MPDQEEHDQPENLVETPHQAEHSARTLQEGADANATLEGYRAINDVRPAEETERKAGHTKEPETREKGHRVP